jgi:hypothetical protein
VSEAVLAEIRARELPAAVRHHRRPSDLVVRVGRLGLTRDVPVARVRVTGDGRLRVRRHSGVRRAIVEPWRRAAVAVALALGRRMDDRLRRRVWLAAGPIVRRLGV